MAGHLARMEQYRNAYRDLVGKPEGKRSLRRPRGSWEDNIKMDLRAVGCDAGDWIDLVQDRAYVRTVMNLRVPLKAGYRSSQRSWPLSLTRIPVGEPWIRKYVCIFLI